MRRIQNAPSESKCQKMAEILDPDHDGTLDLADVEKVCNTLFVHLELRIQFSQYSFPYFEKLGIQVPLGAPSKISSKPFHRNSTCMFTGGSHG